MAWKPFIDPDRKNKINGKQRGWNTLQKLR